VLFRSLLQPMRMKLRTDPASTEQTYPMWTEGTVRQAIYDAQVLNPNPSDGVPPDKGISPTAWGAYLAETPVDGRVVELKVPIHNYSLRESPGVVVKFIAHPVDRRDHRVAAGPDRLIGCVTTKVIPDQGVQNAVINWDTTGYGGSLYRIFVQVDPGNAVDEIHPLTVGTPQYSAGNCSQPGGNDADSRRPAPAGVEPVPVDPAEEDAGELIDPLTNEPELLAAGQNNQGYFPDLVEVMPKGTKPVRTVPNGSLSIRPATYMPSGGVIASNLAVAETARAAADAIQQATTLEIPEGAVSATVSGSGDKWRAGEVEVGMDDSVELRVRLQADGDMNSRHTVLVYDGDPSKGGRLVGNGSVPRIPAGDGAWAFVAWEPDEPGQYDLHAQIIGTTGEEVVTDDGHSLRVTVVDPSAADTEDNGGKEGLAAIGGLGVLAAVAGGVLFIRRRNAAA
jgi:hypothetical protein